MTQAQGWILILGAFMVSGTVITLLWHLVKANYRMAEVLELSHEAEIRGVKAAIAIERDRRRKGEFVDVGRHEGAVPFSG